MSCALADLAAALRGERGIALGVVRSVGAVRLAMAAVAPLAASSVGVAVEAASAVGVIAVPRFGPNPRAGLWQRACGRSEKMAHVGIPS